MTPRVCFYGDDFTGASDALLNFHRFRLKSALAVSADAIGMLAGRVDVLGVAGVARSLPTARIEAEIRPVLEGFRALAPEVVQYKVCSTFDSSPELGSIGRACEVAADVFGAGAMPVIAAQPEFGRWTAFGHHFARASDGRAYRLDRHPTMSRHPATPMAEAQLSVHLEAQLASLSVTELHLPELTSYGALAGRFRGPVVLDCLEEADLRRIGQLIWPADAERPLFCIGSGGLSYALASAMADVAATTVAEPSPAAAILALSGSCSEQTAIQIRAAEQSGWLSVSLFERSVEATAEVTVRALLGGRSVVVYTALGRADRRLTARSIGGALAEIVQAAVRGSPIRRILMAGGDTTGWALRALPVDALLPVATLGMAPICRTVSPDPSFDGVEMLLKGGQAGTGNIFEGFRAK